VDCFPFAAEECVSSFQSSVGRVSAIEFSPNGHILTLGGVTGAIACLRFHPELDSTETAMKLQLMSRIFSVASCTSSSVVAVCGEDSTAPRNTIKIIDMEMSNAALLTCSVPHAPHYFAFFETNRRGLVCSDSGALSVYDLRMNSIEELSRSALPSSTRDSVTCMRQSVYEDLVAFGTRDGHVCVSRASQLINGEAPASSMMSDGSRAARVNDVAFSPSSIVAGAGDGRVWCFPIVPSTVRRMF
jgi:WD40 repeat protein